MTGLTQVAIQKKWLIGFALFGLIIFGVIAYYFLPNPIDWTVFYFPATSGLLSGQNPYQPGHAFFNPPWVLLPFIPLVLLPFRVGVAILYVLNTGVFLFIGYRTGLRPIPLLAFMLSLPVISCILFGQVDGFCLLGLFMPHPVGLIFLLTKPQVGGVIACFWVLEAWRSAGWKGVWRLMAPSLGLFLISILVFGLWPLQLRVSILFDAQHNTSLWPGSLMIGLPLLVYALRLRNEKVALMVSPFLSPYVGPQSWSIALLGLSAYPAEMVAACLASWALFIFRVL